MNYKKTVILIGSISLAIGASFGHDCNLVQGENLAATANNTVVNKKYEKVRPAEAIQQTLINLKAYCCNQHLIQCSDQEIDNLPAKNYPESAYIFDHLLDTAMRRLDGIASTNYQLQPDPMAQQRRTYITQVAEDPLGAQASTIQEQYTNYRKIKNIGNDILKNYNNLQLVTLADKYNNLCEITKNMYQDMRIHTDIIIGSKSDKNSFFNKCEKIVEERVTRETTYVKILMAQKTTKLLENTTQAYTKKHFVEDKMTALRKLIEKVASTFKTIVKQAPVAQQCN